MQNINKGLHHGTAAPRIGDQEIVVLRRHREKSQAVKFRNRLDCKAPVGAALHDGRGDRVV